MRTPRFWSSDTAISRGLSPFGHVYGAVAGLRQDATPYKASVPVLCIGNVTAGGAGKTPVALAFGALALSRGIAVAFLTRGYGGSLQGPVQVDRQRHTARDVGDEPLLLAHTATTWVSRDRAKGAEAAAGTGAKLIIMDDGLQNLHLVKDMALLVVDAGYGFGNGRLIPAGPLREPVAKAAHRCRAAILVGDEVPQGLPSGLTVVKASLRPRPHDLSGRRTVAFAGIGRPDKFRQTLRAAGVQVVAWQPFADHHVYTSDEIDGLKRQALQAGAALVTTEKDYVRIPAGFRGGVDVMAVDLIADNAMDFETLLDEVMRKVIL